MGDGLIGDHGRIVLNLVVVENPKENEAVLILFHQRMERSARVKCDNKEDVTRRSVKVAFEKLCYFLFLYLFTMP